MCKFQLTDKVNIILFEGRFIRQRGEIGGSSVKIGRRIKELERLYGTRQGSANPQGTVVGEVPMALDGITQDELADQMGITIDNYKRYKKLTTLIPELQDMVDDKLFIIKFQQ